MSTPFFASSSSVRHLLDGPLEVLLLKRLPGERISEEEVLAAVEVLQATDARPAFIGFPVRSMSSSEEVIDLECDAGQLWPGGHRSADQGRLADGGGAAEQQLHVICRLQVEAIAARRLCAWVELPKGAQDVLDALRADVSPAVVPNVRPVVLVQSQVGEVGEEGGEGGHLIGTGSGKKVMNGVITSFQIQTDDYSYL